MLEHLLIENFALIDTVELDFAPGFTVITGETGAGKSIIVDALLAVLGARVSADVVRSGQSRAVIEAAFHLVRHGDINPILVREEIESLGTRLLLRREISAKGGSRFYVNDTPSSGNVVSEISRAIFDFHGQHDSQSLLNPARHRVVLDKMAKLDSLFEQYSTTWAELQSTNEALRSLASQQQNLEREQEFRAFQRKELDEINPLPGEEETLEAELRRIENAERIFGACSESYHELFEAESSVRDRLAKIVTTLENVKRYDQVFETQATELRSALVYVEEVARALAAYSANIEFDPSRPDIIRERLRVLTMLRRKYKSWEAVFETIEELRNASSTEESFQTRYDALSADKQRLEKVLLQQGMDLRKKRTEAGQRLARSIEESLKDLAIRSPRFEVAVIPHTSSGADSVPISTDQISVSAKSDGLDAIRFMIALNAGEEPRPLDKVASGGEISRIMLSMKGSLAEADEIPILVFDEIDTGISGRVSQKVGFAIKRLAQYHQVITITHAAQIAALADSHIVVRKHETDGRSYVTAQVVAAGDRPMEIARLISGETVSEASLRSAAELMAAQ